MARVGMTTVEAVTASHDDGAHGPCHRWRINVILSEGMHSTRFACRALMRLNAAKRMAPAQRSTAVTWSRVARWSTEEKCSSWESLNPECQEIFHILRSEAAVGRPMP